ncbi:MAG: hypothetical protein ACRD2C_23555 [Acidimicrobiales bacterium]
MPHARLLLVVAIAGSVAAAAACGTSGYQYVENEDLGVFAKVPDDWAMYDEAELYSALAAVSGNTVELQRERALTWFRGFDSSEEPSVAGSLQLSAPDPRGFVRIQALLPDQRQNVNLSTLRGQIAGADPLTTMEDDPSGPVEVLTDEPVEFDGGYHGVHTVFSMTVNGRVAVVDQTAVLDATSSVLYLFVVACNDRCYLETHSDEIDTIVDSWTIREDGS